MTFDEHCRAQITAALYIAGVSPEEVDERCHWPRDTTNILLNNPRIALPFTPDVIEQIMTAIGWKAELKLTQDFFKETGK